MKRKKRHPVPTFIFSFMPGAVEMYMGYMKNGLSIMLIFAAGILIPSILHASDVWILLTFVIYIYSFFHARNTASMNEEEIDMLEDHYIWDEFTENNKTMLSSNVIRKWGAVILIFIGIIALWKNFSSILFDYQFIPDKILNILYPVFDSVPSITFAIIVIIIGIRLIQGRKEKLIENTYSENEE